MVLREIERRPLRFVLSALGVAMAVAVLVSGRFNRDAIDWFVTLQFDYAQREDITVAFRQSVPERAARELAHVPGVIVGRRPAHAAGALSPRPSHARERAARTASGRRAAPRRSTATAASRFRRRAAS